MEINGIPIRVVGPGSQPPEDDGQTISYIDMPDDMWTYEQPDMPAPETVQDLAGAREAMRWLQQALTECRQSGAGHIADLTALDNANRDLVNQILGEGEVAITFDGAARGRTQEAVLAGVWRTIYVDEREYLLRDLLEVADVPHCVRMAEGRDRRITPAAVEAPEDAMNAPSILVELEAHVAAFERDKTPHVINLSLLPLSEADIVFLDEQLGRGPVDTLSRAYGKCQVISTQVPLVWWVRFYNSMGVLILNTLEVTDVPDVLRAAPEDLRDSETRLASMLTPYWADTA